MMKTLILYMPVLHAGYLKLFDEVRPQIIVLITKEVLRGLPDSLQYIAKKDVIRAVSPENMGLAVSALYSSDDVEVLCARGDLSKLMGIETEIVMPDEDVSIAVAEKYFGGVDKVTLVVPPTPRLRYHRNNTEEKKLLIPHRRIALIELDQEMFALAENVARLSPDWYRKVGGVLRLQNGECLTACNQHQPHEQIGAVFGDPRSLFKSGIRVDLTHGEHAEHVLFGEAARRGLCTEGSWMYITDFPCLACTRLFIRGGGKRLFYRNPSYGLLDADVELQKARVELVEVFDGN